LIIAPLPEKLRAFVALRLSAQTEDVIASFIDELRPLGDGIRWTPRTKLHLTLRFLGGAVPSAMIPALDAELDRLADSTSPFAISAQGTGAFPDLARPRIFWVGLHGAGLIELAAAVETAARVSGFAPEGRSYLPHLTIGRVRQARRFGRIRAALESAAGHDFGVSLIESMILYRSVPGRESSSYEELAGYPLRALS
jgi:2'-5' RNA ligase